jgi:outer membrane lipoprotein-sorting protein
MRRTLLIGLLFFSACHDQEQPPAPTAEQSDQLNEAEDMLNDMAQNEEGPEANASSPSNSSD